MKERATDWEVAAQEGVSRPVRDQEIPASARPIMPTAAVAMLAAFVITLAALVIPNVISIVRG